MSSVAKIQFFLCPVRIRVWDILVWSGLGPVRVSSGLGVGLELNGQLEIQFLLPFMFYKALLPSGDNKIDHDERFSYIWMACLPFSMMNTCVHKKPKYFSSTCCKSWLALNVLWHKWHWNDLSSTLHDDHLCAWKNNKYFSSTCCNSWLAVNVLWHKWHWNDFLPLSMMITCMQEKTQIFFKYL